MKRIGSFYSFDNQTRVLKVDDIEQAKVFFEQLGLIFVQEQHGNGPIHYACQQGEFVFEIYPRQPKQ